MSGSPIPGLDPSTWLDVVKSVATAAVSAVILIYTVTSGVSARIDTIVEKIDRDIQELRTEMSESRHAVPEWLIKAVDRNLEGIERNGDKIDNLSERIRVQRYPVDQWGNEECRNGE